MTKKHIAYYEFKIWVKRYVKAWLHKRHPEGILLNKNRNKNELWYLRALLLRNKMDKYNDALVLNYSEIMVVKIPRYMCEEGMVNLTSLVQINFNMFVVKQIKEEFICYMETCEEYNLVKKYELKGLIERFMEKYSIVDDKQDEISYDMLQKLYFRHRKKNNLKIY